VRHGVDVWQRLGERVRRLRLSLTYSAPGETLLHAPPRVLTFGRETCQKPQSLDRGKKGPAAEFGRYVDQKRPFVLAISQMSIADIADLLAVKVNEYLATFPNTIKVPKSRMGKNKEAVKAGASRVGHHVTAVVFGDKHYSENKNPRVLDVGVDTRLVEYAYWMGDDVELCLASTVHEVQNEMMWYYLEANYDLKLPDVFAEVQQTGHDTPASWDVRFNAEGLTEVQVAAKVREIVTRHNNLMQELRKRYYSPKRQQ